MRVLEKLAYVDSRPSHCQVAPIIQLARLPERFRRFEDFLNTLNKPRPSRVQTICRCRAQRECRNHDLLGPARPASTLTDFMANSNLLSRRARTHFLFALISKTELLLVFSHQLC
jgi:hypothetical protein